MIPIFPIKSFKKVIQRPKKRKGIKIHAAVTSEEIPLSVVIGSGAEYDPIDLKKLLEQ